MARQAKYTEETLQEAVQAVKNGLSQIKAAQQYGVPRQTLQYRLRGTLPISVAKQPSQRLSDDQETQLRDWVLVQAALGLPLSHRQLKEFASRILRSDGDLRPIAKDWVSGFLRRNPEVRLAKAKAIDCAQTDGVSTAEIEAWVSLLSELDETNTQLAVAQVRIERLERQLRRLQSRKKAKVIPDPNGPSAQVEQITETRIGPSRLLEPASGAALGSKFEDFYFEWQLE